MSQLFCVVVTDVDFFNPVLDSPIVIHVECGSLNQAEEIARKELLGEGESGFDFEEYTIEAFDYLIIPVLDSEIIKG